MRTTEHSANSGAHSAHLRRGVQTVRKAFEILRLFEARGPRLSFREIVALSGAHRSSVYRLVNTLVDTGILQSDGANNYQLGTRLLTLGGMVQGESSIRRVAVPALQELVDSTGETAHLTMLDREDAVFLEAVDSPQPVRHHITIGKRVPLHAGASGKLLLAFLSQERIDTILARPLARLTPNTVTDRRVLRRQLVQIRRQGYCITLEEAERAAAGIAAAVRNENGKVIAAVTLSAPLSRLPKGRVPFLRRQVLSAADKISGALGWNRTRGGQNETR